MTTPTRRIVPSATLKTTNGKIVTVDEADLPMVLAVGNWFAIRKGNVWYAARSQYVCTEHLPNGGRRKKIKRVYLHKIIMPSADKYVDHINGDGLDNRRSNLRVVTCMENSRNRLVQRNSRSGIRGVNRHVRSGKWAAAIVHEGKKLHLGLYPTADEAKEVYLKKAQELWDPEDTYRFRASLGLEVE